MFQQSLSRHVVAEDVRLQLGVAKTDDEAAAGAHEAAQAVLTMPLHQTRHVKATLIDNDRRLGAVGETAPPDHDAILVVRRPHDGPVRPQAASYAAAAEGMPATIARIYGRWA